MRNNDHVHSVNEQSTKKHIGFDSVQVMADIFPHTLAVYMCRG